MQVNWDNLIKLRDFLIANPDIGLDMSYFSDSDEPSENWEEMIELINSCDTVGCVIGNAPKAGFPVVESDLYFDMSEYRVSWFKYCERVFGIKDSSALWVYLFDGEWETIDNTVQGAIGRINDALDNRGADNQFWIDTLNEVGIDY